MTWPRALVLAASAWHKLPFWVLDVGLGYLEFPPDGCPRPDAAALEPAQPLTKYPF